MRGEIAVERAVAAEHAIAPAFSTAMAIWFGRREMTHMGMAPERAAQVLHGLGRGLAAREHGIEQE